MYRLKFSPMPGSDYHGRVKQTPKAWTHSGYKTPFNILVIMLSGSCTFTFPELGRQMRVHEGEAAIIPTGVFYRGSCDAECEYYFFHFYNPLIEMRADDVRAALAEAERQSADADPRHHLRHAPALLDHVYLREITDVSHIMHQLASLLAECDAENQKHDVNRMLRRDLIFCRILTAVSECSVDELYDAPEYPASFNRILAYVRENYTEKLTLEGLSTRFGMSKQHIIRMFRRCLGTTATGYINDLKLSHAPELLCHSTLNVSGITAYLGFTSAGYFTRLFRKKYSVSPTAYAAIAGAEIKRDKDARSGQSNES